MNNQRITTHFAAQSTAAQVIAGIDLTGRRAIVTGGASGIGVETARALASANAEVTLAVRNLEAGERVADDIAASTGNKQLLVATPGLDRGAGRPLERAAAPAGEQRRRDAAARTPADSRWLGDAVRDQPSWPLRARGRAARRPDRCWERADRFAELPRAPEVAR